MKLICVFCNIFLRHLSRNFTFIYLAPPQDLSKDIEDAFNFYHYGKDAAIKADINYRWGNVNQNQGPIIPGSHPPQYVETANANTVRVRLGLLSPTFHSFQGYAEYQGVYALEDDYNQGVLVKNTNYSVIQDPQRNEVDQLWLSYKGIDDTLVKFGRQRIKYDDDRFIGNVGWRQLEQTYDAVTIANSTVSGFTVNAAYLGHMQDPLGQNFKLSAPLFNLNYKIPNWGNMVFYSYWLDFQDAAAYAKSSQTYGLRFNGKSPQFFDTVNFLYTAEWGKQSNYAANPNQYSAGRYNFMGGFTVAGLTLKGAMEQLDGYGFNKTFNTPLGTNHVFQGWADIIKNPIFLPNGTGATQAVATALGQGIRDIFATAIYTMMNDSLIFTGIYHDFYDDTGSVKFGTEWDFQVVKKIGKHYSLLAKYANFFTDNSAFTDTQKFWLQGNISY